MGLDNLIGETLRDSLGVLEGLVSGVLSNEVDSLVESSERGDIDGLSLDISTLTNSGGVLSGTAVINGIDQDIDWVLTSLEVDNLKGLFDYSDSLEFLTGVSTMELKTSDQSLYNWHSGLFELSDLISSSSMWDVYLALSLFNGNKVLDSFVLNNNFIVRPFSEKFGSCGVYCSLCILSHAL